MTANDAGEDIAAEQDPTPPSYDEVPPDQRFMSPEAAINAISGLVRTALGNNGATLLERATIPILSILRIIDLTDPSVVERPGDPILHLTADQAELVLEALEETAVRYTVAGYLTEASLMWSVVRALAGDDTPYDPTEMAVLSLDAQVRNAEMDARIAKAHKKQLKKALKHMTAQL
jgi:hypothetical protein